MTNALTLTASSLGRASQPSGAGAVLYVDGDNAVTIDAWPQPSRWIPDQVQLFRGETEVAPPQPGDDWRWVLAGEQRFGVFRAVAHAGDALVESPPMVVQPTPVTVLAGAAEDVPGPYVRPSRAQGATVVGGGASAMGLDSAGPLGGDAGGAIDPSSAAGAGSAPGVGAAAAAGSAAGPVVGRTAPLGPATGGTAQASAPQASASQPPASPNQQAQQWPPGSSPTMPVGSTATGPGAAVPPGGVAPQAGPPIGARPSGSFSGSPAAPGPYSAAAFPGASVAGSQPGPQPGPPPGGPGAGASRVPAHASAQDVAAMVEIPRSEFDGRFALLVGVLFSVLSVGVIWYAATRLLGDPDLFATSTPPAEAVPPDAPAPFVRPANVADRIGLGTSTMVLAMGIVVILAGASLAALEVRARMLRRDRGGAGEPASRDSLGAASASHGGTTARGTPGALRQIAVILDRISQPRAVIAVLVTGGSLVLVGFFGQLHWALRL